MKKILLCFAICVLSILLSCKEKKIAASDVPQQVVSAFNTKYVGASDVEWETEQKDNKTVYEVEFKLDGKKREAEFDANGNFIEEE